MPAAPAVTPDVPPRLELECLKALWSLGEATVRQIRNSVLPQRRLAYTTVMTLMERLTRRGCVQRRKSGRTFLYSAVLSQDEVRMAALRDLLEAHFDGNPLALRRYLDGPSKSAAPSAPSVLPH
jgi:predicted transcriptional regulator